MADNVSVGGIQFDLGVNTAGLNNTLNQAAQSINDQFTAAFQNISQICSGQLSDLSGSINQISQSIQSSMSELSTALNSDISSAVQEAGSAVEEAGDDSSEALRETENAADDAGRGIRRVGSSANSVSNSITSSFMPTVKKLGAAIASAFAVKKIIDFGRECVETAAEVKAINSQFEQTFGSIQASAENAIKGVADNSGILETRLQSVGTSIYAFAKTTGMDSVSALNMMQEALQVTADSAAYYDRSLEDTAESLKSFLKGNFENDAALGLSCTETTRNATANKLYGRSFIELSEAQKQLTLLQMVKDANELSGAMGQAAREADGWENVTGNLKESWKQFVAVIGKPILQAVVPIIQSITEGIQRLTDAAKTATDALADMFGWDLSEADTTGKAVENLAESTSNAVADAQDGAQESINDAVEAQKKAQGQLAGFDNLNILSQPDSDGESDTELPATEKEVDGVAASLNGLSAKTGKLQDDINSIKFEGLVDKIQSVTEFFKPLASAVGESVRTSAKTCQMGISKFLDKSGETVKKYSERINKNMRSTAVQTRNGVTNIINSATESQKRMQNELSDSYSNILGGAAVFSLSFADVFTGMLDIISSNFEQWTVDNNKLFGDFFDGINGNAVNFNNTIGGIFEEIGTSITEWWDGGASETFDKFTETIFDIGTVVLDFWNRYITPFVDYIIDSVGELWDKHLSPLWDGVLEFVSSLMEAFTALWNNWLRPIYDTYIKRLMSGVMGALKSIWDIVSDVVGAIIDVIKGLIRAVQGILDFITGIFTGDMEKALLGFFEFVQGIVQAIWGVIKGVLNVIIDALNTVWSAFYGVLKSIIDGIGDFAGLIGDIFGQDWGFSLPDEPPKIPRLAKGGLVTAPTLAIVGDNKNAKNDPEVVSPLSKLQGMIDSSSADNTEILQQILMYLKMLYEFYKNGGGDVNIMAELDGDVVFKDMIRRDKAHKRRHGKGAFAR